MKHIALLGAGRIGQVHARSISVTQGARLSAVFDVNLAAAEAIAQQYGCKTATIESIEADPDIDGVLICTPTDLHAQQIEQFITAGKAVFCEKPIDLDVGRVKACLDVVSTKKGQLMVGFNRRFDPHFAAVRKAISDGQIGMAELAIITSRDPAAPPADYIRRSGGIFRDMAIHDFDMALFLLDEMPVQVSATGSVLTDPEIAGLGDFDTASIWLKMASGKQAVITNSRRASYGYDQRIEVHGSKGMITAENQRPISIELATQEGFSKPALHDFFMTRYTQAYAAEIAAFISALNGSATMNPTGRDGLNALLVAEAADRSARTGKIIDIG